MIIENIEVLKQLIIETYKKFGDEKVIILGGKSWTGSEIAKEIREETSFGIDRINDLIQLTINLIKRQKI